MSAALPYVGATFLLAFGGIAAIAWRRPLLARLAFREAWRGGLQTALIVTGLALATVGITGALVSADSADDSATLNAYRSLGNVDLTITAPGGGFFDARTADKLAGDGRLSGLVDGVQGGVEAVGSVADLDQRQSEAGIRLIGFDPANQRPFGAYTLVDGRTTYGEDLAPGSVLLSRDLADALGARVGDRLSVVVGDRSFEVLLAGIARREGPGAYGLQAALFAPNEAFAPISGGNTINIIRISGAGDDHSGLATAQRGLPAVKAAAAAMGIPLDVHDAKAAQVRQAEKSTQWDRANLSGMSLLVVVAAMSVVVNLMVMVAEERRRRLGTLRALGLTRTGLVFHSLLEGGMYSLGGALVGIGPGVLLGRYLAGSVFAADSQFSGFEGPAFAFQLHIDTLLIAFATGALATIAAVAVSAWRTSRVTIASAIRDLPEPVRSPRATWVGRVIILAITALGVAGLLASNLMLKQLGGIAVIFALMTATRPFAGARIRFTVGGLVIMAWSVRTTLSLTSTANTEVSDAATFMGVFMIGIVASVLGLSLAAAANLTALEVVAGIFGGRARAALRPALVYLTRRPLRTGLSTCAFALVLAMITLFASWAGSYRPDFARDSGGYDIQVSSSALNVQLPTSLQGQVDQRRDIDTRLYLGSFLARNTAGYIGGESTFIHLYSFTDAQLADPRVRLDQRSTKFADDAAVWGALRDDPSLVVANGIDIDDAIVMAGPDGPVKFMVAATTSSGIFSGLIGSQRTFGRLVVVRAGMALLAVKPGADTAALARQIESALFVEGVDVKTTRALLEPHAAGLRLYLALFDIMLRMALAIGIVTLGILGLRAVVERRRPIGILRAIGYGRREVVASLVVEALLTAALGAVVGIAAGVAMAFALTLTVITGPFEIDVPAIANAVALIGLATVLVTTGPAVRASRLPAAEALRMAD
jgi:putative ABC transport system permease protein